MHVLRSPLVEAAVARHSPAPAAHFNERVALGRARLLRDHLLLQGGRRRGAGRVGGGRGGQRALSRCIQVFREAVPRQGGVVETLRVRLRLVTVVLVALVAVVVLVGAGLAVMVVVVGGGRGSGEQGGRRSGGEDLNAAGPRGADLMDMFEQLVQGRDVHHGLGEGLLGEGLLGEGLLGEGLLGEGLPGNSTSSITTGQVLILQEVQ